MHCINVQTGNSTPTQANIYKLEAIVELLYMNYEYVRQRLLFFPTQRVCDYVICVFHICHLPTFSMWFYCEISHAYKHFKVLTFEHSLKKFRCFSFVSEPIVVDFDDVHYIALNVFAALTLHQIENSNSHIVWRENISKCVK